MKKTGATQRFTDEWVKLYNEGRSIRSISDEYKVCKTVISRAIRPFTNFREKSPNLKYAEEWYVLYTSGFSKADIARKYDISPSVVGRILEKAGVEIQPLNRKFEHLEQSFIKEYKSGLSLKEVGDKFGVEAQTVLNYLTRSGVETRELTTAIREIKFNENYFDILEDENIFVLGMIYSLGNMVRDFNKIRCLRIMSRHREHVEFICSKLGRDKKLVTIQNNEYYYDEIHSLKIEQRVKELGFNTYADFTIPKLSDEKLDIFFDGFIYAKIDFDKQRNSFSFTVPTDEVVELLLSYFERNNFFRRDEIRRSEKKSNRTIIIERAHFYKKAFDYYPSLLSRYKNSST